MMTDEPASNIWDTARFLKLSADMEHDDPEQAPAFKRDQQLTDAALFKAKVMAVISRDANAAQNIFVKDKLNRLILEIEEIPL